MAVSTNDLQNILNRAKKLCNPSGDAIINEKRDIIKSNNPSTGDYDADAAKWDSMFSSAAEDEYREARDIQYNEVSAARSSLPEAIKKSMLENRINVGTGGQGSILDTIGIKPDKTQQPNRITEAAEPRQYVSSPSIDYSLIKTIVSECVREALANQTLNESAIKGIALKGGTISILDNSGNVYRAKLEKVKSGDDKQKTEV